MDTIQRLKQLIRSRERMLKSTIRAYKKRNDREALYIKKRARDELKLLQSLTVNLYAYSRGDRSKIDRFIKYELRWLAVHGKYTFEIEKLLKQI